MINPIEADYQNRNRIIYKHSNLKNKNQSKVVLKKGTKLELQELLRSIYHLKKISYDEQHNQLLDQLEKTIYKVLQHKRLDNSMWNKLKDNWCCRDIWCAVRMVTLSTFFMSLGVLINSNNQWTAKFISFLFLSIIGGISFLAITFYNNCLHAYHLSLDVFDFEETEEVEEEVRILKQRSQDRSARRRAFKKSTLKSRLKKMVNDFNSAQIAKVLHIWSYDPIVWNYVERRYQNLLGYDQYQRQFTQDQDQVSQKETKSKKQKEQLNFNCQERSKVQTKALPRPAFVETWKREIRVKRIDRANSPSVQINEPDRQVITFEYVQSQSEQQEIKKKQNIIFEESQISMSQSDKN